jgi:hypothetical protein
MQILDGMGIVCFFNNSTWLRQVRRDTGGKRSEFIVEESCKGDKMCYL